MQISDDSLRSPSARVEFFFQNSSDLQEANCAGGPIALPLVPFVNEEMVEHGVVMQAIETWVHPQIRDPA